MFYAVGCPPFRAHRNFGPNFDAATNPHDGTRNYSGICQTRNTDTPPTPKHSKKGRKSWDTGLNTMGNIWPDGGRRNVDFRKLYAWKYL